MKRKRKLSKRSYGKSFISEVRHEHKAVLWEVTVALLSVEENGCASHTQFCQNVALGLW